MHAVAEVRASTATPPRDGFAATDAVLTRHALGAHAANYAFAFAVVNEPDGALALEVARSEEFAILLTGERSSRRLRARAAAGRG